MVATRLGPARTTRANACRFLPGPCAVRPARWTGARRSPASAPQVRGISGCRPYRPARLFGQPGQGAWAEQILACRGRSKPARSGFRGDFDVAPTAESEDALNLRLCSAPERPGREPVSVRAPADLRALPWHHAASGTRGSRTSSLAFSRRRLHWLRTLSAPSSSPRARSGGLRCAMKAALTSRFARRCFPCSPPNAGPVRMPVDWRDACHRHKLTCLVKDFGYFYEGHRTLDDCPAAPENLTNVVSGRGNSCFGERQKKTAPKAGVRNWGGALRPSAKDALRARGYRCRTAAMAQLAPGGWTSTRKGWRLRYPS